MRILFIQPPLPANIRHKRVFPLGLAYIASYIRKEIIDIEVQILDALVLNLYYSDIIGHVRRFKPDVVGITFWSAQAPFSYRLAEGIKKLNSDITIVFGGIHTTCRPEEAIEFSDYCILHEAEETFKELINAFKKGDSVKDIAGLVYKEEGDIVKTSPRGFIEDLDQLPYPAWDLLPVERYDTQLHVIGGCRIPIVGSRGCPYNCSFCVSPFMWRRKVRFRSAVNIVNEIKHIIRRYGIKQFHFWDDNLLIDREHIKELCLEIIKNGLDIKWVGLTRASHITQYPEIMPLLEDAGCIGLETGIESVDPETFSDIDKKEEVNILKEAGELQKEHRMYPLYTFMNLNPGETISSYYFQAMFIDELLKDLPWYEHFHSINMPVYIGQFCTPHVGTKLYKNAEKLGLRIAKDWKDFNHHTINFVPDSLLDDIPKKQIKKLRIDDYIIATSTTWSWMYELHPFRQPYLRQLGKRIEFIKIFYEFFNKCNGKLSLKEIVYDLSEFLNIGFKKSLKYSVVYTIISSQLGLIRSALYDVDKDIRVKKIPIPKRNLRRIKYFILYILARLKKV